jgi:hypothetical protein
MAGPATGRDLHIDRHLTQIAINYRPQEMIADMIAPIVPVAKETDTYPVFNRKEAFAIAQGTLRARGTEANKIKRSVSSAGYICKNYALGYDVPIEDRANMDAAFISELETGATQFLLGKLYLDWEKRANDLILTAANVATTFVPNSAWNAPIGTNQGDPVSQILKMIEQNQSITAQRPNSIIIGWRAWVTFRRNEKVRNFVNGTNNGGGLVTREQAKAIFEVDRFLVSQAFYDSTNENQAESLSSPLHDRVYVYYAPLQPSRETPSWMYSFRWTAPGLPAPLVVERHPYNSRKKVDGIEAGYYQDEKITGADYASCLAGVNSAQSNGIS